MPGAVALQINRYRQAGNMSRPDLGMHRQGSSASTQTQRPDAQAVHTRQKLFFKVSNFRVRVWLAYLAQQCLLCQQHGSVSSSPYAQTDNQGGAGIGTSLINGSLHQFNDTFLTISGLQHSQLTHILGTSTFGHATNLNLVTGYYFSIDYRGSIIVSVFPGRERLDNHGFTEIALSVALAYTLGHGSI